MTRILPKYLDKAQLRAIDLIEKQDLLIIRGKPDSGKSFFLSYLMASVVLEAKKVLFIAEDEQALKTIRAALKSKFLERRIVPVSVQASPNTESTLDLINWLKKKPESLILRDSAEKRSEIQYLRSRLTSFYEDLNKKELFDKPWHELVVLQAFDKMSSETLHYNHLMKPAGFNFANEEYESLLDVVITASDMVETQRASTDTLFSNSVFEFEKADKAWSSIESWIREGRKKTNRTLLTVNHFLDKHKLKYRKEFLDYTSGIKAKVDRIYLALMKLSSSENLEKTAKNRSIFSSKSDAEKRFQKEKEQLIVEINQLLDGLQDEGKEFTTSLIREPVMAGESADELKALIESLRDQILNIKPELAKYIRQKLDALNSNHAADAELLKLDEQIQQLYQWINDNGWVRIRYESTAFSVNKNLNQLEDLLIDFNTYLEKEESFKYYFNWNHFYFGLDRRARGLIDKLLVINPANWVSFYRNWYVQNVIDLHGPLFEKEVDDLIKEYHPLIDLAYSLESELDLGRRYRQISNWSDENKKQSNQLYKELQGKNSTDLSWAAYFQKYGEVFSTVFPIVATIPEAMEEWLSIDWDLIVVHKQKSDEKGKSVFTNSKEHTKKLVWTSEPESEETSEEITELLNQAVTVDFNGNHLQNVIPMIDMNHTERLHTARNLAHLLQDLNPGIEIFHLDGSIIFSTLSKPLNTVFHKLLDKRGIKKMRVLESPFHLLVENLLEVNSRRVLITQDSLINNSDYERLDWQLFVRRRLLRAGLEIIDFKTYHLLNNPLQVLIKFTDQHFPENSQATEPDKMEKDE